jgi:hypothetical protein
MHEISPSLRTYGSCDPWRNVLPRSLISVSSMMCLDIFYCLHTLYWRQVLVVGGSMYVYVCTRTCTGHLSIFCPLCSCISPIIWKSSFTVIGTEPRFRPVPSSLNFCDCWSNQLITFIWFLWCFGFMETYIGTVNESSIPSSLSRGQKNEWQTKDSFYRFPVQKARATSFDGACLRHA